MGHTWCALAVGPNEIKEAKDIAFELQVRTTFLQVLANLLSLAFR